MFKENGYSRSVNSYLIVLLLIYVIKPKIHVLSVSVMLVLAGLVTLLSLIIPAEREIIIILIKTGACIQYFSLFLSMFKENGFSRVNM